MTDRTDGVSRRRFVSIAAASAAVPALAGCTSSGDDAEPADGNNDDGSDDGGNNNGSSDGSDGSGDGGGGGSTVIVGPGGDFTFDPEELTVSTGTTVTFEWDSNFHNVVPTSQPSDADWSGETDTFDSGHTYEYTFEVAGTYEYVCEPHEGSGMTGTIIVE